jgi:hypothetical protein
LAAQQVNAIGTGWSRIDVLPPEVQQPVRAGFQAYVDALIVMYREEPSRAEALKEPDAVTRTREELWSRAVAACSAKGRRKSADASSPVVERDVRRCRNRTPRAPDPFSETDLLHARDFGAGERVFVGYAVAGGARGNGMYMSGGAATVAVAMYVSSSSNIHASAFFAPMLSITRWSSCEQR